MHAFFVKKFKGNGKNTKMYGMNLLLQKQRFLSEIYCLSIKNDPHEGHPKSPSTSGILEIIQDLRDLGEALGISLGSERHILSDLLEFNVHHGCQFR